MIVGSGLLAKAFSERQAKLESVCLYAAGVSNSSCRDELEFERDQQRLQQHLAAVDPAMLFVYFSTCSVLDPWSQDNHYTLHKSRLEALVRERGNFLIVRLPQVAGKTPNPHTLLNYLYNRIVRSERFDLWRMSSRNIIDVSDIVSIVADLILHERVASETVNVANARNFTLPEIVAALETVTRHRAVYNSLDKGGDYAIDTTRIASAVRRCGIVFDDNYLLRTFAKYYE
jgi:nucleoside-diphosphate-sugar epimerase